MFSFRIYGMAIHLHGNTTTQSTVHTHIHIIGTFIWEKRNFPPILKTKCWMGSHCGTYSILILLKNGFQPIYEK